VRLIVSIFAFTFVSTAQARWVTREEAGSVIDSYTVEYNVQKNGAFTETVDYNVRVQAEDAKVSASLFNIDYNSATDTVEVLEAYTLNGKEKIPVEASAIEDRDKGEAKDYDAMKVRSVVFPQVEIGSRLHVKYIVKTSKPLMEGRWSVEQVLGPSMFIEKLRILVKSEVPIYSDISDPHHLITKRQKNKNTVEFINHHEIPGWVTAEKDPYFHPKNYSYIWVSTHKDWAEFFGGIAKDYAAVLNAPLPKTLQGWVKVAAKKKTAKEQILFLMEHMSRNFRYFGDWRRHNGGLVPRTLAEIEKSRYGDCKDLASLLTAMLRGLKMDAHVALVRRGENAWGHEPDYVLPDMSRFNHAIVEVKNGSEIYWLDATNPVSSLQPFPDISGRPAWIMEPAGRFERLPDAKASDFLHVHEYQYFISNKDNVEVKINAQLKNLAPYHIANELLMAPRQEVLTDTLEYFAENNAVTAYHYTTEPTTTRAIGDMKVGLDYTASRVTFDAGKDQFFAIPDGFLAGPFYETEQRESDMHISDTPFLYQGTRRLKNAKLMQAKPEPCKVESEWMDLERRIEADGNDVVIYQNVNLKKTVITRDEFRSPAFHKLQAGTKACFYRSGVLVEPHL